MSIAVTLLLNINSIFSLSFFQKLKITLNYPSVLTPPHLHFPKTTTWKLITLDICIFILYMCVSIHSNYFAFEYFKALFQRGQAIGNALKFFFIRHHLMSCVRINCPI